MRSIRFRLFLVLFILSSSLFLFNLDLRSKPTSEEIEKYLVAYTKGDVDFQIRRFAGDKWITAGNPDGSIFNEGREAQQLFKKADYVILNIARTEVINPQDNLVASIELSTELVPNPPIDEVLRIAKAQGKYVYKNLGNLP